MKKYIVQLLFIAIGQMVWAQQITTSLPLHTAAESYTTAVTNDFTLQNITFTPTDTIFVHWSHAGQLFSISGTASTEIAGADVNIAFGHDVEHQLLIGSNNSVTDFELFVTDPFTFNGLTFTPMDNKTTFRYDFTNAQFEITGDAQVTLDNVKHEIKLGLDDDPGIIYKDNALQKVVFTAKETLNLRGLAAGDPNLTLKWYPGYPTNTYYGHGVLSIFVEDGYFKADLGSNSKPGLTVVDGKVDEAEMDVRGGALLFGALPTYDSFKLQFNKSKNQYLVIGSIVVGVPFGSALHIPTLKLEAGDEDTGGIAYDVDSYKLKVESATFSLTSLKGKAGTQLGGFELNKLAIKVENNVVVDIDGIMTFPPGFSLEVDIGFRERPNHPELPYFVDSIQVNWTATKMTEAIPMGETGFSIVSIGGGLVNIDQPSKITLEGRIGMIFGDLITIKAPVIGKKEVAIAYFEAEVDFSAREIKMMVEGDLGAFIQGGQWVGLLGTADVTMDLKWGVEYSMEGKLEIPADPHQLVTADAKVVMSNNGDINMLAKVRLTVPDFIPIIGGKSLGGIDGALHVKNKEPNQSYSAGWTKINLIFDHIHIGAKMNMGSGDITKIGAGQEKEIVRTIESDAVQVNANYHYCGVQHHFTIDGTKPAAYLQNELTIISPQKFGTNQVTGGYLIRAEILNPATGDDPHAYKPSDAQNLFDTNPEASILNNTYVQIPVNKGTYTAAWVAANSKAAVYGDIDWQDQPGVLLTPGEYILQVTGYCLNDAELSEDDFELTTSPVYPRPTVEVSVSTAVAQAPIINIDYTSYLTDSTDITIYWNHVDSVNGQFLTRLTTQDLFGGSSGSVNSSGRKSVAFDPGTLTQENVWAYAVINDHVNSPVYSNIVMGEFGDDLTHVKGQVTLQGDNTPVAGVPIILLSTDTTINRVTIYTDAQGNYEFRNVVFNKNYTLQVHAPDGHHVAHEYDIIDAVTFDGGELKTPDLLDVNMWIYNNDHITANFNLVDEEPSVFGTIFDENYNTIPGITVEVKDTNGNIVATQTTSKTGYAFYGLASGAYQLNFTVTDGNYHWDISTLAQSNMPQTQVNTVNIIDGTPAKFNNFIETGQYGPAIYLVDSDTQTGLSGVEVLILGFAPDHTYLSATTNAEGMAVFPSGDVIFNTTYNLQIDLPPGYHLDTSDPRIIVQLADPSNRLRGNFNWRFDGNVTIFVKQE